MDIPDTEVHHGGISLENREELRIVMEFVSRK
jgi:hypothetical protein